MTIKRYVPREPSFISTQFFVLNLDGWFGILPNKFLFFQYSTIMLSYKSQIINIFLSSRDTFFFRYFIIMLICNCFWIILLRSFWNFVILSAILWPIKSLDVSAVFFNCFFRSSFKCLYCRLFSLIKKFLTLFWISRLKWIALHF